jgi:hypothetical protein
MKGDSSRNEGICNIAEFHDHAIPRSEGSDGSANGGVSRQASRSVNEGIHALAEFAGPVQQFHGNKASTDGPSDLSKGRDARSESTPSNRESEETAKGITDKGPIAGYLRATGKTREAFDADLKRGDPATAAIFAGEVLFGAMKDLIRTIEGMQNGENN